MKRFMKIETHTSRDIANELTKGEIEHKKKRILLIHIFEDGRPASHLLRPKVVAMINTGRMIQLNVRDYIGLGRKRLLLFASDVGRFYKQSVFDIAHVEVPMGWV